MARFAAGLLGGLLANMGMNNLPAKMGMSHIFSDDFKASDLATRRVMVFFAMLFATVEASHRLDLTQVESLASMFIQFGGDVLLGVGILLIGFWLANLAHRAIMRASSDNAVGMTVFGSRETTRCGAGLAAAGGVTAGTAPAVVGWRHGLVGCERYPGRFAAPRGLHAAAAVVIFCHCTDQAHVLAAEVRAFTVHHGPAVGSVFRLAPGRRVAIAACRAALG